MVRSGNPWPQIQENRRFRKAQRRPHRPLCGSPPSITKWSAQSPVRFPAWHYKVVRTVPCAVPRSPFVLIRSTFAFQKSHPPFIHSSPFIPHSRSKKGIPLSQSLPARLRPAMQAGLPVRLRPAMQAGPRLQAPKSHRLRRSRPQVSQHTTVKNRPLTLSCLQQAYCCAPLAPSRRRLPVATHPPPTRVSRAGAGFRRCFSRGGWRGGARSRRG